jgi:hypothetical protein
MPRRPATTKTDRRTIRRPNAGETIALLDRRLFTWETPGRPANRRLASDDADVTITDKAPANLHADVLFDDDEDRNVYLWIGITDQQTPHRYQRCYAVIGGSRLIKVAKQIVAYRPKRRTKKGGAR